MQDRANDGKTEEGRRLALLRTARGFEQKDLAQRARVSPGAPAGHAGREAFEDRYRHVRHGQGGYGSSRADCVFSRNHESVRIGFARLSGFR